MPAKHKRTRKHQKTAPAPRAPREAAPPPSAPKPSRGIAALFVIGARLRHYWRDLVAIALMLIVIFLLFGLLGLSNGAWLMASAAALRQWFGWGAGLVPLSLGGVGLTFFAHRLGRPIGVRWGRVIAAEAAAFALLGLFNLALQNSDNSVGRAVAGEGGGIVGWGIGALFTRVLGTPTDAFVLAAIFLGGLFLSMGATADRLARLGDWLRSYGFAGEREQRAHTQLPLPAARPPLVINKPASRRDAKPAPLVIAKPKPKLSASERVRVPVEASTELVAVKPKKRDKRLPSLDLLDNSELRRPAQREIDQNASVIVKTLKEFGIPVNVVGARVGPSVTQFQVEPGFVEKTGAPTGNAAKLLNACHALGEYCAKHPDLTERELMAHVLEEVDFFAALGYETEAEEKVEQTRNAVLLRNAKGRTLAIMEFRKPGKELAVSDRQWDEDPLPEVGALCNGHELWICRFNGNRMSDDPIAQIGLAEASEAEARTAQNWLGKKQQWKVRVAQIAGLKDDLALALSANTIRIEAPVPGQSYVGIEVPHKRNSVVTLRPVMESEAFQRISSPLALALGRDVSGAAIAADLATMPHLLIAGTTGSGKSVCIVSFVTCLAANNTPDDLRIVLIDPKMVELVRFNGLPHLMGKVETDLDRITGVLRWVVREMERRYKLFETHSARNLQTYAAKTAKKADAERLPRIVVMIDELADLMMRAPDETERTVVRLAQMARATGIHLVVATQRPSTDVVTGLIKANFPARLSFAVASNIDSRVILDTPGAESLLGKGDMLFLAPEVGTPMRLQGCFVGDKEVDRIVTYWREQMADEEPEPLKLDELSASPEAADPVELPRGKAEPSSTAAASTRAPWDEMLARESVIDDKDLQIEQAIQVVKKYGTASASLLQRKMRIGYPRAARLMDELKEMGLVGREQAGGKTREVFVRGDDDPIGERAAKILGDEDEDE